MNRKEVREYLLSKPGAREEVPFQMPVPVFKVGGKLFALLNIHEPDRASVNLKYPKDDIQALRSAYEEVLPGYHMNKNNWNTIYLDGTLSDEQIKQWIDISYQLVFQALPRKQQKEILESGQDQQSE